MLVTVADIVKRLCPRGGDEAARLKERVMHWARKRVLETYSGDPGKGAPRLFEHGAIPQVAFLRELAEMGFEVIGWQHVLDGCRKVREAARYYAHADQKGRYEPQWLDIEWEGRQFRGLPRLRTQPSHDNPAVTVRLSVNLGQIFGRLAWDVTDETADESLEIPERRRSPPRKSAKRAEHTSARTSRRKVSKQ